MEAFVVGFLAGFFANDDLVGRVVAFIVTFVIAFLVGSVWPALGSAWETIRRAMETFVGGLLIGFLANWAFVVWTRLLRAELVRYPVQIGDLSHHKEGDFLYREVSVKILLPDCWRVTLKEPLREYLHVRLKLDKGEWVQGKWTEGDLNVYRLLADGAMRASAIVFTCYNQRVCLADDIDSPIGEGNHTIDIQVIRSWDEDVADKMKISFAVDKGKLVLGAVSRG